MKKARIILRTALSLAVVSAAVSSCSHDPLDIETDGVNVSIDYRNFDSLLVNTDTNNLRAAMLKWHVDIPEVIDYTLGYCLNAGEVTNPSVPGYIYQFRTDPYFSREEQRIAANFKDLSKYNAAITEGFRHLKAHLKQVKIPAHVVYINSFFAASAFSTEKDIAIGLDRYLGPNTDVIRELPGDKFPNWIKEAWDPRYLERDALASWIMTHIIPEEDNQTNIEAIIHWGKIIYLTEAAFPEADKSVIIRYSEQDYQWALKNERDFWNYLVKEKMLFITDEKQQANLLKEAPFTAGLPEKGPDRLGQFLGWRIVQSYMKQYELTLPELLKLPYTELLQEYEIN